MGLADSRWDGGGWRLGGGAWTALLAAALVAVTVWCVTRGARRGEPTTRVIVLQAYSALDEPFEEGVLPAFQAQWHARTGEALYFATTFDASRAIVERLRDGAEIHVAILATEVDAGRLPPAVALPEAWQNLPHRGVLARTPVVLHVREGNPHGIAGFDDLLGDGVSVLRPDPRWSGLGAWSVLAVYGAARREGLGPDEAFARLRALERASLPPAVSARAASRCFRLGVGDVAFAYEQDLLPTPERAARPGAVVRPPRTILCEPVVVVLRRNVPAAAQDAMDAFVAFLWSPAAQAVLAAHGFLAPDAVPPAGTIRDPFTLADLGGAEAAREVLERLAAREGER